MLRKFVLGVDVGGSFTDCVLVSAETGSVVVYKVPTTPKDYTDAIMEGVHQLLAKVNLTSADIALLVHGTTVASNAVIEKKGAKTALLTTQGFRDVLEMGREFRYDTDEPFIEKPAPLVPRRFRLGVRERTNAHGVVLTNLDKDELVASLDPLVRRDGIESIAVVFLHSYASERNEDAAERIIRNLWPSLYVSVSHEVAPFEGEHERTSTTVLNAYTKPIAYSYLSHLKERLKSSGIACPLHIMLSDGSVTTVDVAREFPVRIIESGPAAGALAAQFIGSLIGEANIVAFDMGGTTTKVCLISNGTLSTVADFEVDRIHRFKRGSGYPILAPAVELAEMGAGGGSLVYLDSIGRLRVGPESMGADPGPACYRRGGSRPTVTDADLILGYLNPKYFLGGRMPLDSQAASEAITRECAHPLSLDLIQAAGSIFEIVNENMASMVKTYTLEKGKDPRSFVLVAFGGAGPIHAYEIARKLRIRKIICPYAAGVLSAVGMTTAPPAFDFAKTKVMNLDSADWVSVNSLFAAMENEGFTYLAGAGISRESIKVQRFAEMRYVGQGTLVRVLLPDGDLSGESAATMSRLFTESYRNLYGRTVDGLSVEGVNWRLRVQGEISDLKVKTYAPTTDRSNSSLSSIRNRPVYFNELKDFVRTAIYKREALRIGEKLRGPAIVEDQECTVVVGPSASFHLDNYLDIIINLD